MVFWKFFWIIFVLLNSVLIFTVYKIETGIQPENWAKFLLITGALSWILASVFISAVCAVYLEQWYERRRLRP